METLASGVADPAQDGGSADAEVVGDLTKRWPLSHSGYHGASALPLLCLLMLSSNAKGRYPVPPGGLLFRTSCHSAVPHLLALRCSASPGICPVIRGAS